MQCPLFATPKAPGFGGRQAFSKGEDQFYRAMASVTSAAAALGKEFNHHRKKGEAPDFALCVFPIVVVEGELFEASYDVSKASMVVEPAQWVRCHWPGSPDWDWHATVDVVALSSLPRYIENVSTSVDELLPILMASLKQMREAFDKKSILGLEISRGSRGMIGIHPLLREIVGR
jgi:hypothetical protein